MKLKLLYFARLREQFAMGAEEIELAEGSVADLLGALRARGGAWATELAEGRAFRVGVNQDIAQLDTGLKQGDEVAIFPPVTGG
jgi:molybdopterin synthase sulfur carrier subunit